jgi:hypothetical protein
VKVPINQLAMIEIPNRVRHLFVTAGWHPGRSVRIFTDTPDDHPAYLALREFDGLRVGESGPGLEVARSDIRFSSTLETDECVRDNWEQLLRTKLVWIAEVQNAHAALIMSASGQCYGCSLVHDAFFFTGRTLGEATERLLLGQRSRPMLRPEQNSVLLYGKTFPRGHPEIHDYA